MTSARAPGAERETYSPRLAEFLHLLACPRTGERLRLEAGALRSERSGHRYLIRNGVPILTLSAAEVEVKPSDVKSNPLPEAVKQRLRETRGWALNLGAGGSEERFPRCLELETGVWRHTDVVGDAHHLPFRSSSFEYVVALNAFEHLLDPWRAASEIWRVLAPGGSLYLLTAFLQPLHEAPRHYYNCTEFGLRQWFSRFEIDGCSVSGNFNPVFALSWVASEIWSDMKESAGPEWAELLDRTSLAEMRRIWSDPSSRRGPLWEAFFRMPQELQKKYAAGFELRAHKPLDPRDGGASSSEALPREDDLRGASAASLLKALSRKALHRLLRFGKPAPER